MKYLKVLKQGTVHNFMLSLLLGFMQPYSCSMKIYGSQQNPAINGTQTNNLNSMWLVFPVMEH